MLNKLKYSFKNKDLLEKALTHSSYAHENKTESNETLEFLGDRVISLIITDFLIKKYPRLSEGQLSYNRSLLECNKTQAIIAKELELQKYIRLGKGEEKTGGRTKDSILGNTLEALIGALYLDTEINNVFEIVTSLFIKHLK